MVGAQILLTFQMKPQQIQDKICYSNTLAILLGASFIFHFQQ